MRFATTDQINLVASLADDIEEYQGIMSDQVTTIAGFIEAYSPTSGLEIRYITGEGRDDERWRGALLAASPSPHKSVDCWCITVTITQGLSLKEVAPGEIRRPYSLGVDYYFDYDFGTDANNSESKFNAKVDGFEFLLEQVRTCLPNSATLESWLFRRMIKRFTNASTHIAKGDLAFTLEVI